MAFGCMASISYARMPCLYSSVIWSYFCLFVCFYLHHWVINSEYNSTFWAAVVHWLAGLLSVLPSCVQISVETGIFIPLLCLFFPFLLSILGKHILALFPSWRSDQNKLMLADRDSWQLLCSVVCSRCLAGHVLVNVNTHIRRSVVLTDLPPDWTDCPGMRVGWCRDDESSEPWRSPLWWIQSKMDARTFS